MNLTLLSQIQNDNKPAEHMWSKAATSVAISASTRQNVCFIILWSEEKLSNYEA